MTMVFNASSTVLNYENYPSIIANTCLERNFFHGAMKQRLLKCHDFRFFTLPAYYYLEYGFKPYDINLANYM